MNIKDFSLDKIKDFGKYFQTDKFWGKLKKYAKIIGREAVYHALVLYYMMLSKETSWVNKAYIIGALGYLIFPLDFIPDAIPIVGYSDDFAAIMMVYNQLKGSITPEVEKKAREKLTEWFDSKQDSL